MKQVWKLFPVCGLCLCLTGCVKMALRLTPSFIPRLSQTFFEECDADLAGASLPASLKLMEGLLKNDPENRRILTALCTGFSGYALLFVEDENPETASSLYLRARDYGLKALGWQVPSRGMGNLASNVIRKRLESVGSGGLEALFWTTMAWNAWINLNLDQPAALGQLSAAQACLERVLEIKPDFFYGAPYILMGTILSAMPGPLGGDAAKARQFFEKSLEMSKGKFFLAQYYFARYYAVRAQNKRLFLKLIEQVRKTAPDELREVCLINAVMKRKIDHLQEMTDDLFLCTSDPAD